MQYIICPIPSVVGVGVVVVVGGGGGGGIFIELVLLWLLLLLLLLLLVVVVGAVLTEKLLNTRFPVYSFPHKVISGRCELLSFQRFNFMFVFQDHLD